MPPHISGRRVRQPPLARQAAIMTGTKVLLVLLALVPSTGGDVRARDPEVEQEEDGQEDWGGAAGVISATEETPLMQDGGNYPARSGNWCAFVQKRMVTVAVACGTEKYTIKSQSPCPSRTPDCHLVMYKLSTRPLYRQKQKVTTALLWRCCPGRGGDNCDDTVADAQSDSANSSLIEGARFQRGPGSLHSAGAPPQQQHSDPNREQSDHRGSANAPGDVGRARFPLHLPNGDPSRHRDPLQHPVDVPNQERAQYPTRAPNGAGPDRDRSRHPVHAPLGDRVRVRDGDQVQVWHPAQVRDGDPAQNPIRVHHRGHVAHPAGEEQQRELFRPGAYEEAEPAAALPLPHVVALLMSQLQPSLQLFNDSLEQLGQRVERLARDVAQLRGAEQERRRSDQQVAALSQRLESALHSQSATLHYNVSNIKTDLDLKIKRHNKMLQVSLQAMNATLAELKLDQELEREQDQDLERDRKREEEETLAVEPPRLEEAQLSTSANWALWEAVGRLDKAVVNTGVKTDKLAEELAAASGGVRQLRRDLKALGERLNQTARTGQVLFMETGLEVEAAKVAVLERVEQLAGNLSRQGQRLLDMDVDVDYLFGALYKNNASSSSSPPQQCDCGPPGQALARLEGGVANATELARRNRLALEEEEERREDWEATVEALQRSLKEVKERMTSEQSRTATLESGVRNLSVLLQEARAQAGSREDAPGTRDGRLGEEMKRVLAEMKQLSASFNSLLKDAIRHSDVLEILLGEEVLEFLEWPVQDQEAHSIPALKEQMRILREALAARDLGGPGDAEEAPSADEPQFGSPGGRTSRGDGRPAAGDGGDLWKLEGSVEELRLKLLQMEEAPCCLEGDQERAALRTEVERLKRGLEEHLRTFKDILGDRAAPQFRKVQEKKKHPGGEGGGAQHGRRKAAAGETTR